MNDGVGERIIRVSPPSLNSAVYISGLWNPADLRRSYSPPIAPPQKAPIRERSNQSMQANSIPSIPPLPSKDDLPIPIVTVAPKPVSVSREESTDEEDHAARSSATSSRRPSENSSISMSRIPSNASIAPVVHASSSTGATGKSMASTMANTWAISDSLEMASQPPMLIRGYSNLSNRPHLERVGTGMTTQGSPSTSFRRGFFSEEFDGFELSDSDDDEDLMADGTSDLQNGGSSTRASLPPIPIASPLEIGAGKKLQYPGVGATADSLFSKSPNYSTTGRESALTSQIKSSRMKKANPLEAIYAILSGQGDIKPLKLRIYRPSGSDLQNPLDILIKSEATVAETIGYSLYRYYDEKRQPQLTQEQCNISQWALRLIDDGEVDEDFPALDRARKISKFAFDEFALVEVTAEQVKANEVVDTPFKRSVVTDSQPSAQLSGRPSPPKLRGVTKHELPTTPTTARTGTGISVMVKLVYGSESPSKESTTLNVTSDTYLAEVLAQGCRKRGLAPDKHVLRIIGTNIVAPLDRTVDALQGRLELEVMGKSIAETSQLETTFTSASPDAPIVPKNQMLLRPLLASKFDFLKSSTYQRFTVWRRYQMTLLGRHERVLAIDGDYIHIMPTESKTLLENPRTSSFPINSILQTKQSRKVPINFKIVRLKANGEKKRYDFEAVSTTEATEIVQKINILMNQ